jgi:hypothetical protein
MTGAMKARTWVCGLALGLAGATVCAQTERPAVMDRPEAQATEPAAGLPASIPLRRSADTSVVSDQQWALALWALLVIAGVSWVIVSRRRTGRTSGKGLGWTAWLKPQMQGEDSSPRAKGQVRLTQRHSLHVVQWHGVEYLVACSDHGVDLVDRQPLPTGSSSNEGTTS